MITYKQGDLLTYNAEAIVNTVNCVGVMGRGIALQFKKQYPENFKQYEVACKRNEVVPGKMFVYALCSLVNPRYIINFPTKRHWKNANNIEDIENGLLDGRIYVTFSKTSKDICCQVTQTVVIEPIKRYGLCSVRIWTQPPIWKVLRKPKHG